MFILKSIYCRVFQTAFRLAMPILPYREPEILDSCSDIKNVIDKEGIGSVLIVTDIGIVKNGLTASLEAALKNCGVSYWVYDKTSPNPTVENVEEALELYKQNHCTALIAIGGGSSMDCAKAVGARVAFPKRGISKLKGLLKVRKKIPTVIAIPTTAGTGSEVTLAAVISDHERHQKYALMDFNLIPKYAVLDPMLTVSLPPSLTASTGIDALTHAVEAFIGRSTTKETRRLALEATEMIFKNIERAYNNPNDIEARANMLHASYKAGISFSKSYVGYIHAVAHSLGGRYGTPHGLANAVVLPYVLEDYGECIYKKLHLLAVAAGVSRENDGAADSAKRFIEAVKALNARMNIPDKLSGIKKEDISDMAVLAEKEANPLYPVPRLMTAKQLERFYYSISDWSDDNDRN